MDCVPPQAAGPAAEPDSSRDPATSDRLGRLAELLGGLAGEVNNEAAARLPLVARDVFARLARLVGAQRVVLWHAEAGQDRLVATHEWSGAGPGTGPSPPSGSSPSPGSAPGAGLRSPADVGEPDGLPWAMEELAGAELLIGPAPTAGGPRSDGSADVEPGTVVALPLLVDGALDAVLSLHWPGPAPGWSPALAPLVRAVATLLRGAERLVELAERPALDEATGLGNRKLLLVALSRSLAQLERRGTSGVAVVACQVPAAADARSNRELVRQVGRRLDHRTREGDLVAVFDGRTLVVVCDDVAGSQEALAIAHRLSTAVTDESEPAERSHELAEATGVRATRSATVTAEAAASRASFGVAYASQRVPPGVVLRQADAAAYLAAASGELVRLAEG